jgi:hypothetical protein
MLANHAKEGLPAADIQVIRRGKALEYFSRHYGKVLVEEGRSLSVTKALVGINQLIEEETDVAADLPPVNAEQTAAGDRVRSTLRGGTRSGIDFEVHQAPRRAGDPASIIADNDGLVRLG